MRNIQRQREAFAWRFARFLWSENPKGLSEKRSNLNFLNKASQDAGISTSTLFGDDPNRQKQRQFIENFWWNTGGPDNQEDNRVAPKDSPKDRLATLLAGYPGSGKSFILKHRNIRDLLSPASVSNPDPMKYLMMHMGMGATQDQIIQAMQQRDAMDRLAQKGYDPQAVIKKIMGMPQYSPGDLSPLMHKEASDMNKRVQRRMLEGGHNITLDGTLGDENGEQEKLDMLKSFGYGVNGILINASRGPSEQRALQRYASGDEKFLNGEADEDWYDQDRAAPRMGLGDLWTPDTGFPHPLDRHAGGRFVGDYVAPPDPGSPWKGQSHKNFHELMPGLGSAIVIDADQDYAKPRNAWSQPEQPPLHVEDGFGHLFDGVLSSGGIHVPKRYAYRVANEGGEKSSYQMKYEGSAADLVTRYRRGEIDYPTMAHFLVERARYLVELEKSAPEKSYWQHWVHAAEGVECDDIFNELEHALFQGDLTKQQESELVDLVKSTGYQRG
jgi:predicted kinase